ncbi:MAG: hypothetical protein J5885_02915 [Clostridia bacterium]|nr:hypothetical protein [Clostridia bacterium]
MKKILNHPKSFFIVAFFMFLLLSVVMLIPAMVPWEIISRYCYSENAGHEVLNAVALVYCVIMVLSVFIGIVSNQIAIVQRDRKSIHAFWFLIVEVLIAGFGYWLIAYSKTGSWLLTPFCGILFFFSYLLFLFGSLICFLMFFITKLVIRIKKRQK